MGFAIQICLAVCFFCADAKSFLLVIDLNEQVSSFGIAYVITWTIRGGAGSAEGNFEPLEALAARGRRERKILPFFFNLP